MKLKSIFVTGSLISMFTAYSQDIVFFTGGQKFVKTEITFLNGKVTEGYLKDFRLPRTVEVRGPGYEFKSFEKKLRLDSKQFSYKKELTDDKAKAIGTDSIKAIKFIEGDSITYFEKMTLKTVNTKNQLIDLEREVFLPLIQKGKIDLYGLKVKEAGNDDLITVLAYIKKPEDNFAVIPIDMNRLNIFNVWSMEERFVHGFKFITTDCAAFQALMDERLQKIESGDKEYKQTMKESYQDFMKNAKGTPEDKFSFYYYNLYLDVIDDYSDLCSD